MEDENPQIEGEIVDKQGTKRRAEEMDDDGTTFESKYPGVDNLNTQKSTDHAVKVLRKFLSGKNMSPQFEQYSPADFNKIMSQFYTEARQETGELYRESTLKAVRFGVHRYLESIDKDIRNDLSYLESQKVFKSVCRDLTVLGKDPESVPTITQLDFRKLHDYFDITDSVKLQEKVFVDVMLYLVRRNNGMGRADLRYLKISDFILGTDKSSDERFVSLVNGRNGSKYPQRKMYERKGDVKCPVKTFLLYKQKLDSSCDIFFQRPLRLFCKAFDIWYDACPLGQNCLGAFMPTISEKAALSKRYTNLSLQMSRVELLDVLYLTADEQYGSSDDNTPSVKIECDIIDEDVDCTSPDQLSGTSTEDNQVIKFEKVITTYVTNMMKQNRSELMTCVDTRIMTTFDKLNKEISDIKREVNEIKRKVGDIFNQQKTLLPLKEQTEEPKIKAETETVSTSSAILTPSITSILNDPQPSPAKKNNTFQISPPCTNVNNENLSGNNNNNISVDNIPQNTTIQNTMPSTSNHSNHIPTLSLFHTGITQTSSVSNTATQSPTSTVSSNLPFIGQPSNNTSTLLPNTGIFLPNQLNQLQMNRMPISFIQQPNVMSTNFTYPLGQTTISPGSKIFTSLQTGNMLNIQQQQKQSGCLSEEQQHNFVISKSVKHCGQNSASFRNPSVSTSQLSSTNPVRPLKNIMRKNTKIAPSPSIASSSVTVTSGKNNMSSLVSSSTVRSSATQQVRPITTVNPTVPQLRVLETPPTTMDHPIVITEHPAPLPKAPAIKSGDGKKRFQGLLPPKPMLSCNVTDKGIVVSWNIRSNIKLYSDIKVYQLYSYQEDSGPPSTDLWKLTGELQALTLPMAATLTEFHKGYRYYFAVRAVDVYERHCGFSDPVCVNLMDNKQ